MVQSPSPEPQAPLKQSIMVSDDGVVQVFGFTPGRRGIQEALGFVDLYMDPSQIKRVLLAQGEIPAEPDLAKKDDADDAPTP